MSAGDGSKYQEKQICSGSMRHTVQMHRRELSKQTDKSNQGLQLYYQQVNGVGGPALYNLLNHKTF